MKPEPERRVRGYVLAFCGGAILATFVSFVLFRTRSSPAADDQIERPAQTQADRQPVSEPRPERFQRMPRVAAVAGEQLRSASIEATTPSVQDEGAQEFAPEPAFIHVVEAAAKPQIGSVQIIGERGRLSGKVSLRGAPPAEKPLPLDPFCAAKGEKLRTSKSTRFYVVGKDHGLADVIVSIVGISAGEPIARTNVIVQQACLFEPYISAMQVGGTVLVQDKDDFDNPLVLDSKENGSFHERLKRRGTLSFRLEHPEEFVRIRSESKPFQFAYITVFDHPFFAVTDKNGEFVINGIPPGRYTVQAQHRKAGAAKQEITIETNRGTDVQFVLNVPATQTASVQ